MSRPLVIVPAFNEERSLARTLDDLRRHFPEGDVLVVDDGSSDATAQVASGCGALVASLPFNLGVGGALRTGFRFAQCHNYDVAVQVDADGQHPAHEIRQLVLRLDGGADMVIGSRFVHRETTYRVSRTRALAMRCLRWFVSFLAGRQFTDTSSGFRAFGRNAIDLFASNYPRDYLSDTVEALLIGSYGGLRIEEVAVEMRSREEGIPSNRYFRLVYHYLRLLVAIALTASLDGRKARKALQP